MEKWNTKGAYRVVGALFVFASLLQGCIDNYIKLGLIFNLLDSDSTQTILQRCLTIRLRL